MFFNVHCTVQLMNKCFDVCNCPEVINGRFTYTQMKPNLPEMHLCQMHCPLMWAAFEGTVAKHKRFCVYIYHYFLLEGSELPASLRNLIEQVIKLENKVQCHVS